VHLGLTSKAARERAVELLDMVGIGGGQRRLRQYPHEFSGGMCQRVMIAMAIACRCELLIADEPTTALDVTVQAGIMQLLRDLQLRLGMALLLISHDLDLVAGVCDRVAVMYAGRIVETGEARLVTTDPLHPYAAGLLTAHPSRGEPHARLPAIPGTPPVLTGSWERCAFLPRCSISADVCRDQIPQLESVSGRDVRCLVAGRHESTG
jgi:peptide/nickel transport system ATP-binding protein